MNLENKSDVKSYKFAFTLVELLVVISIIAIMGLAVTIGVSESYDKSIDDIIDIHNKTQYVQVYHDDDLIDEGTNIDLSPYQIEDIQYCEEHNIPHYDIKRDAGCIINSPGNINAADIRPSKYGFIEKEFSEVLLNYLINKGIQNVVLDHNDILIDGYKVASSAGYALAPDYKWIYTGFQISINQDLEAIKNICLKPMKKVPKGLGEYGITTEEMEKFIIDFFKDK